MIDRILSPSWTIFLGGLLALLALSSSATAEEPTSALQFAALAFGGGVSPESAALSVAALETAETVIPDNNPALRQQLGTATLILMGQTSTASLTELAYLETGDQAGCWNLVNADLALPISPVILSYIPDKATPLPTLTSNVLEYQAISYVLVQAAKNSLAAFHTSAVANHRLTYATMFQHPGDQRGKVVHIDGHVQWVRKLDTPPRLKEAGLDNLYEVWIVNRIDSATPYCVLLTELPSDLALGKRINVPIALDGYFLKCRVEPENAVPVKAWRTSLLIAGRSLTVNKSVALMLTRPGRATIGAATLVMNGTSANAAPLETLALLRHGEHADCWTLVDSDVVRPIAPATLAKIKDGKTYPASAAEGEFDALLEVLVQTWSTSPAAFEKAGKDVGFSSLFYEPNRYRGEVVHIKGMLRQVQPWDPPVMAAEKGVPQMYEATIFGETSKNPYIVLVMELPEGVPLNEKVSETAEFDGYFYKNLQYKALDSIKPGDWRLAPLLIGRSLKVQKTVAPAAPVEGPTGWIIPAAAVGVGVLTVGVCLLIFMAYWLRRGDVRVQERLHAVRTQTFVLPTPDDPAPLRHEDS